MNLEDVCVRSYTLDPITGASFPPLGDINKGRSYTFSTASPFSAEIVSNIGAPRTYGVRLSGKF